MRSGYTVARYIMASSASILVLDERRPNPRKIQKAADILDAGGVIAYPTDTVYGIGCDLHNRKAIDRIYRIKGLDRGHRLSFICQDLSNIAEYAYVTDFAYRWLQAAVPRPLHRGAAGEPRWCRRSCSRSAARWVSGCPTA